MSAVIESNILGNPRLAAVCLDALLKSFVVLAFAGGLCLAWRRAAAATRHLIWCLALASLLCLPLLPYIVPVTQRPLWSVTGGSVAGNEISLSLEFAPVKQAVAVNHLDTIPANSSTSQPVKASGRRLFNAHVNHHWLGTALAVWIFGLLLTLLYPVVGRFQLRKISDQARPLDTPEWTQLLTEASETLGLRRRVELMQSQDNVMPLTWGWLRPKVLMPAEAVQWPDDRRRVVLLHELAHVKRRDCLTQNIARFVCALYWFNPLAWIGARRMCIERERACDDLVLNGGCKASDYAGHLVQIARTFRRAPQAAGIAMARSSNLEQRVTAIIDASRSRRLRPVGLAGVLVAILAVIFYIGGYKASIASDYERQPLYAQQLIQVEKFAAQKEAQSQLLTAASGETISPEFQKFFDAAKVGDVQTVTNMYADFKAHHPQYSKNPRWGYRTSYWSPVLEICLAYDYLAMSDPKYTQIEVDDMIGSLPPGSIYFGGTDPGRGLPTAFSKSHVDADPFYTLTQNALADPTYLEYLRKTYGAKRLTLTELAAARRADPELSALDLQFQAAEQKAVTLEINKPDQDPEREAAEQVRRDLNSKIDEAMARITKTLHADENSAASNQWSKGKVIYIPTGEDSQRSFTDYMTDAQTRLEEGKLKPGENIKVEQGRVQVSGQTAVMAINARLVKIIFDKNPDREFYIEVSFPLDWIYPYLEPHGLIMKIDREPMATMPDDVLQRDRAYWKNRVAGMIGDWIQEDTPIEALTAFADKIYLQKNLNGFSGDPAFVQNDYAVKAFSKLRSDIADVYAWRAENAGDQAEKDRMAHEADFAFRQAFALCPYSREGGRYVEFLKTHGRLSDARAIADTAARVAAVFDKNDSPLKKLSEQLKLAALPTASAVTTVNSNRLQELRSLLVEKQAEFDRKKTLLEHLKVMDREALEKALPVVVSDNELNTLRSELDLARQSLIKLKIDYAPEHPKYQNAQAAMEDLQRKIHDRTDGLMIGLQSKLEAPATLVATIKAKLEDLQPTNPHNP